MVTLIDNLAPKEPLRHPEKQNRPEAPVLRKPDWLRVKAPGTGQYNATRSIVKEKGLHTVEETLVGIGDELGATLGVMGAYGHSRLRETLFGGVTRFAIDAGTRPLLLVH